MGCTQRKVNKLTNKLQALELLEKRKEKIEIELNMYGYEMNDKKIQMFTNDFIKMFNEYKIIERDGEEYPYKLVANVGEYTVISLLSPKKYHEMLTEGVIPEVIKLAKTR